MQVSRGIQVEVFTASGNLIVHAGIREQEEPQQEKCIKMSLANLHHTAIPSAPRHATHFFFFSHTCTYTDIQLHTEGMV